MQKMQMLAPNSGRVQRVESDRPFSASEFEQRLSAFRVVRDRRTKPANVSYGNTVLPVEAVPAAVPVAVRGAVRSSNQQQSQQAERAQQQQQQQQQHVADELDRLQTFLTEQLGDAALAQRVMDAFVAQT
jgi:hypothetical protein